MSTLKIRGVPAREYKELMALILAVFEDFGEVVHHAFVPATGTVVLSFALSEDAKQAREAVPELFLDGHHLSISSSSTSSLSLPSTPSKLDRLTPSTSVSSSPAASKSFSVPSSPAMPSTLGASSTSKVDTASSAPPAKPAEGLPFASLVYKSPPPSSTGPVSAASGIVWQDEALTPAPKSTPQAPPPPPPPSSSQSPPRVPSMGRGRPAAASPAPSPGPAVQPSIRPAPSASVSTSATLPSSTSSVASAPRPTVVASASVTSSSSAAPVCQPSVRVRTSTSAPPSSALELLKMEAELFGDSDDDDDLAAATATSTSSKSHADASNGLSSSQPPFLSKSWSMRPGGVERLHGESHPEPLVPTLTSLSGNPELSPLNLSRAASQVNSRTTSPLATPSFDYPKHAPIVTPTKFATTSTAGSSGSDSRGAAGSIQARFVIVESTEVEVMDSTQHHVFTATKDVLRMIDKMVTSQMDLTEKTNAVAPTYMLVWGKQSKYACGLAKIISNVEFQERSGRLKIPPERWHGEFNVSWVQVKDIPETVIDKTIQEIGPAFINWRSGMELPKEAGLALLLLFATYQPDSTILQGYYHRKK